MRITKVVLVGKKISKPDEYTLQQTFKIGKTHWTQMAEKIVNLHEEAEKYGVTFETKEVEYDFERQFRIILRGKKAAVQTIWSNFVG